VISRDPNSAVSLIALILVELVVLVPHEFAICGSRRANFDAGPNPMAQVGEMWHQDLCSPKADRLYDSLEKSAIIIYPKALLEKSINLKSTKQNIVKRENRTSAPNTGTGIIAMTEISLASLNESVDVPLTDAWGY
jgi:hypothetical protein